MNSKKLNRQQQRDARQIGQIDRSFFKKLRQKHYNLAFYELMARDLPDLNMEVRFHPKVNMNMRNRLVHTTIFALVIAAFAALTPAAFGQKMTTLEVEQRLSDLGYWITKVDGKSDDSTRQAILAFQKVEGRKRTGVMNATDMALLRSATRPTAKYDGAAHIEVDISRQVLFYVGDDGSVERILAVSTGNDQKYFDEGKWQVAHTPRGNFKVQWKFNGERKASLGTLYYPSYFNGGIAVHGSPSIPAYAASHGCVRVPRFADKAIFKMMPVGMQVYVYDHS
jgi:hypothetical protein